MKRQIVTFPEAGRAELLDGNIPELAPNTVLVENEVSAISTGTERACLLDLPNLADTKPGQFPKQLGYSGVGRVLETDPSVTSVQIGDRVLTHWGSIHSNYNVISEENLLKLDDDSIPSEHAVYAIIAGFSLNGLRKTRLEIGESAAVVGLGILGIFALMLCHIAGGAPVIAADLNEKRRKLALSLGAHFAFDPADPDYTRQVKDASRGGVNAVIEVTGQSIAMKQALGFTAKFGRIALLGCTRVSDTAIDYYQEVHRPGIELIGAHTNARPSQESRPHSWTWKDDARALLSFMADGRMHVSRVLAATYSPQEASAVYKALAEDENFPVGAVFDWRTSK